MRNRAMGWIAVAALATLSCDDGRDARSQMAMGGTATAALQPATAPATAPEAQAPSKALIARGDSIFHGKLANGICAACHGQNAKGMPGMGADLTDATWLHGDGSVKFIETIIRSGVAKPKKSTAIMPPLGGVPLDSAQVAALAAYVFSLSHR